MEDELRKLAYQVVFEKNQEAEKEIRARAEERGIKLDSTQKLYQARAKEKWSGFIVPAINIRTLTYDTARAIFREVTKEKIGAFIFELARSEIGYTDQSLSEYVSVILAAAVKERYRGLLFFQGDHFQAKAKNFFNPLQKEEEITALKDLIKGGISAGVYNIDIDSSTLVRLEETDLDRQQKYNCQLTAQLTSYIRSLEPKDLTISVGGEVGEIGGRNSTPEDMEVFMRGYNRELKKYGEVKGLIKIAVQTGATHGGIVLPSGEIKKVDIDFETLKKLSDEARKYGMGGAVQHGASTLPEEYFDKFAETGAVEIHLATAFQNIVYDSDYFPGELKEKIYDWLRKEKISEKKPDQTEEQFLYKTRKRALGLFKKEIWDIPPESRDKISEQLEGKFAILFKKLGLENTAKIVEEIYF